MKAIIMAAGIGSRLFPMTMRKPKTLMEICGKTILEHKIENLRASGVDDIVVVTGFKSDMIKELLKDSVRYIHNPFYEKTNSIVSAWFAKDEMTDDFLLINADLFCDRRIVQDMVNDKNKYAFSVAKKVCVDEDYKIISNNGIIVDMDKEVTGDIYGAFTGIAKVSKDGAKKFLTVLDRLVSEGNHDTWFETVFKELIREGQPVSVVDTKGRPWIEIDFETELESAVKDIYPKIMNPQGDN